MDATEEDDDELLSSDDEETESGRGGANVSKGTPSTNIVVSPLSIKMPDENFVHTSSNILYRLHTAHGLQMSVMYVLTRVLIE